MKKGGPNLFKMTKIRTCHVTFLHRPWLWVSGGKFYFISVKEYYWFLFFTEVMERITQVPKGFWRRKKLSRIKFFLVSAKLSFL